MQITMTLTLNMSDDQRKAWANEYGLDLSEVNEDATNHLSEIVVEQVKHLPHVRDFTSITGFMVE